MAAKQWDLFFNELFQDYLATAGAVAGGVPAAAVCPLRIIQETDQRKAVPFLLLGHVREEAGNVEIYRAQFSLMLSIQDDETAPDSTDPDTAEGWLRAVLRQIGDMTAFRAFVEALPAEDNDGTWGLQRLWVPTGAIEKSRPEEEAGRLDLAVSWVMVAVVTAA